MDMEERKKLTKNSRPARGEEGERAGGTITYQKEIEEAEISGSKRGKKKENFRNIVKGGNRRSEIHPGR